MRSSDWSSDVCSADLNEPAPLATAAGSPRAGRPMLQGAQWPQLGTKTRMAWSPLTNSSTPAPVSTTTADASWPSTMGIGRAEGRRVGQEWVSTWRYRRSQEHLKHNNI